MQTFLPYRSFAKSARTLDRARLGKQRVENLQIAKALTNPGYGWQNHPAVKMWQGYEVALMHYQLAICYEWKSRGYKDTCIEKTKAILPYRPIMTKDLPPWIGREDFHVSHRSNLLRKDPLFYGSLWPCIPDDLPYVWPI